jgi:hypothetical protein
VTCDEFRKLALSMPGAAEGAHNGHPDFRAQGRIFASLADTARGLAMVKCGPAAQTRLVAECPGSFRPCQGAWGRAGATYITLDSAPAAEVRAAIEKAWELVALK